MIFPPSMDRLQAVILLDGSVRSNPFIDAIARSPLNLPIDNQRDVLDFWKESAAELADRLDIDRLPMRIVIDRASPQPTAPPPDERIYVEIERDPVDFRGSGGLARDIAVHYDDDDLLLIASGAQLLLEPLWRSVHRLAMMESDVAVTSHSDGTPSGLLLVRCGALRDVSPIGYVDMKEQALPLIAQRHDVKVVHFDQPTGLPVRTRSSYLRALRSRHQTLAGATTKSADPFREDCQPVFAIAEKGSRVAPDADLLDSVVLAGGQLESGAVAVRTVVSGAGIIATGQTVLDEIVERA